MNLKCTSGWDKLFSDNCLERQYLDFHRFLLGLKKSTRREAVFAEFGKDPLCLQYWRQILNFWNKTVVSGEGKLTYAALVDSVRCHIKQQSMRSYKVNKVDLWFTSFLRFVEQFGVQAGQLYSVEVTGNVILHTANFNGVIEQFQGKLY